MAAGFVDFVIIWRADVFSGAPQQSSAASFGTLGITFRARKARTEAEWATALETLNCEVTPVAEPTQDKPTSLFGADAFYDAGDTGCAYGPLDDVALLLRKMASGQTLEIRATDPSVAVDLPAWCRLTGHQLVSHQGDRYLIRRS
ncbi:MAG TPA: sulfurtransferase TusA family protein [Caldilineaceae bacterium]|nr:sulfurtransferase TusA family protein [Caldilineaceae bacterium]